MKNNTFLKGEISTPIDTEEKPDEYGYFDSCIYAQVSYAEPEIGYYEVKCELTSKQCCEDHCPMEAKYTVREVSKEEWKYKLKAKIGFN